MHNGGAASPLQFTGLHVLGIVPLLALRVSCSEVFMKAATACVKITPQGEFYLDGYGSDERRLPALGVHDDPYAVLLLLDYGSSRVLFVSIDVCIITLERTRAMRQLLTKALDIDNTNIVVSSIHSHSCPTGLREGGLIDKESYGWPEMVAGVIVQAATALPSKLTDVKAEMLKVHVRGWYSNRNSKDKPFDDEAYVIRFKDSSGNPVAGMLNFNCHATVVGPTNRYLSTDLQGAVREKIAAWMGVMPYAFTGASGDLGNRQFRQGSDFSELERTACGIAHAIMMGRFQSLSLNEPSVSVFRKVVDYDNTEYFETYREKLARAQSVLDDSASSFDEKKLARTEVQRMNERLATARMTFPIDMRVYDFGELVIVTFPGELGSSLGMRIKGMFGDRPVLMIGYANDYQGYFVPAEDFGLGYESNVTKLPAGGIERILDEFEDQL